MGGFEARLILRAWLERLQIEKDGGSHDRMQAAHLQFVKGLAKGMELVALLRVVLHLLKGEREEVFDALNERLVHQSVHLLVDIALVGLGGKRLQAHGRFGGHRLRVLLLMHTNFSLVFNL